MWGAVACREPCRAVGGEQVDDEGAQARAQKQHRRRQVPGVHTRRVNKSSHTHTVSPSVFLSLALSLSLSFALALSLPPSVPPCPPLSLSHTRTHTYICIRAPLPTNRTANPIVLDSNNLFATLFVGSPMCPYAIVCRRAYGLFTTLKPRGA